MGKRMMASFIASGMLLTVGGTAGAIPPEPADPEPFTVPADESCGDFGVTFQVLRGKDGFKELPGRRTITIAPGLTIRVTNDETGESVVLKIQGSFHETYPAPNVIQSKLTGRNLLFGPEVFDDEPGILLFVGRFDVTITIDDEDIGLFDDISGNGQITDICAVLS
jgi:hypothetical protein